MNFAASLINVFPTFSLAVYCQSPTQELKWSLEGAKSDLTTPLCKII